MGSKKTNIASRVMMHTLVIFSPSPRLGIWRVSLVQELISKGSVSWTKEVSLNVNLHFGVNSCVCVFLCV